MKTDKPGDARGRASGRSSFVGDPGATFSGGKRNPGAKQEQDPAYEENSVRSFCFCFSSIAEPFAAARSGQGRAVFQARRERTLDGEDRCETMGAGGKDLFSSMQDMCHHGGKDE
jgi:hypothetical protein